MYIHAFLLYAQIKYQKNIHRLWAKARCCCCTIPIQRAGRSVRPSPHHHHRRRCRRRRRPIASSVVFGQCPRRRRTYEHYQAHAAPIIFGSKLRRRTTYVVYSSHAHSRKVCVVGAREQRSRINKRIHREGTRTKQTTHIHPPTTHTQLNACRQYTTNQLANQSI